MLQKSVGGAAVAIEDRDRLRLGDRFRADPPRADADFIRNDFGVDGFWVAPASSRCSLTRTGWKPVPPRREFAAGVEVVANVRQAARGVNDFAAEEFALRLAGAKQRAKQRRLPGTGVPEQQNARNESLGGHGGIVVERAPRWVAAFLMAS